MQDQTQPVNHSWWTRYPVKKDWAAIGVILLLATFLRFNGLNEPGLWLDEVSYTFAAQKPIIDQITNPSDTLGGYLSVDPALSAIPFSLSLKLGFLNFLARFPAALFGILGVGLIYRVGRTLFGNRVGLTAALLLSTSSFHILYSQEARSYAQFVFFSLASFLFLYQAFARRKLIDWLLYAVFTWAGVSTNHLMLFAIAAQSIWLGLICLQNIFVSASRPNSWQPCLRACFLNVIPRSEATRNPLERLLQAAVSGTLRSPLGGSLRVTCRPIFTRIRFKKHVLRVMGSFLLALSTVFLLRLPWLEDFSHRQCFGCDIGHPSVKLDLISPFIWTFQEFTSPFPLISLGFGLLGLVGLILALAKYPAGGLLIGVWLILSYIITAVGLWFISQFFHPRYIIWGLPALLLAIACGLIGLGEFTRGVLLNKIKLQPARLAELTGLVATTLLVTIIMVNNLGQIQQNPTRKQAWPLGLLEEATRYLAAESENGAVIIGVPNAQHLKFYLQYSRPDLSYLDASSTLLPAELPDRWYVFYEARNIPARWQKELSYREFYDILVVHLPGRCPIDRCLHEATGLLSEAAQANPGSALEQKIKLMLSGLSNLAAH